jgi:outer membrane protein OmpA-like peptidoglycan-associated protein
LNKGERIQYIGFGAKYNYILKKKIRGQSQNSRVEIKIISDNNTDK